MQKATKILYVLTKSDWGGAQRYVFDLATNLPRDQFDIVVACGPSGLLIARLEQAGIRVIPIVTLRRDIRISSEIRSFVSLLTMMIRERPDIVHLNSSKVGGLGAIAARFASLVTRHSSLVVFTVHGWAFLEDRSRLWRSAALLLSWLSSVFQDRIILIDAADMRSAERFIPHRKLVLIPNGIALPALLNRHRARNFLAARMGRILQEDAILIGTITELTNTKGLGYLIETIKLLCSRQDLSQFRIVIIGSGEDERSLRETIVRENLQDTIVLLGYVPDAAHYLRGFDIFVLPSVKEGLPYTILEAMAAGISVIATRVGGIPDLIADGVNGIIVPSKDPSALCDAIALLLRNPSKRQEFGKRLNARVKTEFTLERMMDETMRAYGISRKQP